MADARGNILGRRMMPVSRRAMLAAAAGLVVFGVLVAVMPAHAFGTEDVMRFVASILQAIVGFLGEMVLVVVEALIWIAQYNDFVNATPVATGWTLVRDVANMFFVVALLIIAFGTILGSSSYNYEGKRLTTFLIMAIIVNFSRTLCGLLIDFAQVVMLTFVNGFKEAAGGNFVDALKLGDMLQVNPNAQLASATNIVVAFLLALTMLGMSLFLMITMTAVLVVRIVYLWLLVILSPIAFLARAVPLGGAQSYYGRWWGMFNQQVVVGPVLAFFLWLSLVSISAGDVATKGFEGGLTGNESLGESYSAAFNVQNIQQFIIAFGLLAGGLMMAKEMSPQGAALAGKATGAAKGALKWGAGQAYKRSGLKSYRDTRAAVREERQAQREQARGARIAGVMGGIRGAPKGLLAKGMRGAGLMPNKIAAQSYRQQAAELRAKGGAKNLEDAGKLEKKADRIAAKKESRVGRAFKGALSAPARALAGGGAEEREVAALMGGKATAAEKAEADRMTVQERSALALGAGEAKNAGQFRAATLKSMEAGDAGLAGNIGAIRERMLKSGASRDEMQAFNAAAEKNFAFESDMAPEKLSGAIANGNINLRNVPQNMMQEVAAAIAGAPPKAREAYTGQMMGMRGSPEADKQREGLMSSLSTAGGAGAMQILAQVDPQSAMKAMGAADGKFADQEGRNAFSKTMSAKGAEKVGLAIDAEQMIDKDTGEVTDIGREAARAAMSNPALVNSMARNSIGGPQDKSIAALVEAVKQVAEKGSDADRKVAERISGSRSLENYQSYTDASGRDVTAAREGRKQETARQAQAVVTVNQQIENNVKNTKEAQSQYDDLKKEVTKAAKAGASRERLDSLNNQMAQVKSKIERLTSAGEKLQKEKELRDKKARGG